MPVFPEHPFPRPGAADYQALGLRCGLEVHYQLDTRTKLFCRCPVGLRNDPPDAEIVRHMRPTLSELGEYDGTALMEFKTRKEVRYQLYYDTVCTYEMDDTPPFPLNQEALDIALEIALLLNCRIVDEIHVSRKQYLDGSIPTGFQRTIAVGVDGWIPFRGRRIRVLQLCLEEDACREISDRGHVFVLRTDRLSTPLVEVITAADMTTPGEAAAVDREIGRILRATGKVRRGIGSVRQDVNVSIEGGARAEIKGVPRTGMILPLVHYEALRQKALLSLGRELENRGITRRVLTGGGASGRGAGSTPGGSRGRGVTPAGTLCTELFRGTRVRAIAESLLRGEEVGAVKLEGFAGLLGYPLGPGRSFADELRGRVRVIACLDRRPVLLHDDLAGGEDRGGGEDPDGGEDLGGGEDRGSSDFPHPEKWRQVRDLVGAGPRDTVALVWGPERDVRTALG
ncbi:MAG: Glu-tRNA(Gln) amidotransferase subunit GatE, partial [Spirochaetota bacterium]